MSAQQVRRMRPEELAIAVDWAANEGWDPGHGDAEAFWAEDQGGFLVAEDDDGVVGSVSVVRYDEEFAFAGFFVARPDRRGEGIGHQLVEAALALAGDRTIGLDGVVAQQDNYRLMGFEFAFRSIRYRGVPQAIPAVRPAQVVLIDDRNSQAVIDADRGWFPAQREAFLQQWLIAGEGRQGFVVIQYGMVLGYAVVRPSQDGNRIGPLFARYESTAEALFQACLVHISEQGTAANGIALDVPEPNEKARLLAERHGLQPAFETARMYRGAAPDLPIDEIYGVTTFELG